MRALRDAGALARARKYVLEKLSSSEEANKRNRPFTGSLRATCSTRPVKCVRYVLGVPGVLAESAAKVFFFCAVGNLESRIFDQEYREYRVEIRSSR